MVTGRPWKEASARTLSVPPRYALPTAVLTGGVAATGSVPNRGPGARTGSKDREPGPKPEPGSPQRGARPL